MDVINIIGGSGFVGTRLAKRLSSNNQLFNIVDKNPSQTFPEFTNTADVCNKEILIKALKPGIIINLSAEHRDDVRPLSLYDDVNIGGARNTCNAAEELGINTIIFTSSVAVYGFAPLGTDESGEFNYFNDYGRTKLEAEKVYKAWHAKDPENRKLIIIRPTVVFGEGNRGNVYNLLKQIASGKFVMIGNGKNVKSMAYVENVAAFIQYTIGFDKGIHIYNYIDKPDFDMNTLVNIVYQALGKKPSKLRLPYAVGYVAGKAFDCIAAITGKQLPISSIRIKKFCSNTMFNTSLAGTGFVAPVKLDEALANTIKYEFVQDNSKSQVFYTE